MTAIDTIKKKHEAYKVDEGAFWMNKFTYKSNMKYARPNVDLMKFAAETGAFKSIVPKESISGFLNVLDTLSERYVTWALAKDSTLNDEREAMRNWFKGVIGEYFYLSVLSEVKALYISPDASDNVMRFDFDFVAPIEESDDYGVDLLAVVNGVPSVIQVKTHYNYNESAKTSWYLKAYGDGCANNYINQNDKYNTFLCWFSSEDNGLFGIRQNRGFNDKALCVGRSTLNEAIDKRNPCFWKRFYDSLGYIG